MNEQDQFIVTRQLFSSVEECRDQIMAVSPVVPVSVDGYGGEPLPDSAFIVSEDPLVTGFLVHSEDGPVYRVTLSRT